MWQILIDSLTKKRWQTKQHTPPCAVEWSKQQSRKRLDEANERKHKDERDRKIKLLRDATVGMDTWRTIDLQIPVNRQAVRNLLVWLVKHNQIELVEQSRINIWRWK